jgi:8-oxo-dGTP diphosphatase
MVHVVAAIIERDGRVLICRRTAAQSHPLKWEFPGGKVEPGEGPEEALARELEEELGLHAVSGEEITRYGYQYPGRNPIQLIFYRVGRYEGEPANLVFHEIRWAPRETLREFDFVEGDHEFIARFGAGAL